MKKPNAKCEFSSERSRMLLQNFRESIARQSQISLKKALHDATSAPAPRFWVSEIRAYRVVSMLMKGELEILESMHAEKREMYLEIFRRVEEQKRLHPEMSLGDIVYEVVNSPAPRSYLSQDWAYRLIRRKG